MAEHFPKSTVEATVWCPRCSKATPHYIADGRRGGCKTCIARLEQKAAERQSKPNPPEKSGELFTHPYDTEEAELEARGLGIV